MMPSSTRKKEGLDVDSEDSNSVSSKPDDDKQSRMRWGDISFTTNEPSSASATVVTTSVARHRTAQSVILPTFPAAAAAAAPAVRLHEKKPRRDGFREQFLQKLRVMLDRESQNDSASVQWSADGNSFIVTDQTQFEEQTIPTYFGNHIVFASFLRKLQRWGFNRRTNRRNERYEFCSPTFKRIGAVVNETGNDGGCTSITNPATTNDFPSSVPATVSSVAAVHPTAPSGLPTLAAAAAAPPVPLSEKKPRRAGFRDEFLHRLRVMLDRESQNDSASVQWSADGKSFIVTDQTQFEAQTIPTYFGNQIVFASFLRKLQRWGFNRVSTKQAGRYEFFSPTFKRIGVESPPAVAAAAAAAVNTTGNDRGVQQQPTLAFSPLLQVMAQTNQPPAPNLLTNQADANAITALLSNIQHQSTGQQSVLNLNTNQPNNADGILQSIMGSTLLSQNTVPSLQQPVLNNVDANSYLQPFQQWQPPNPTINLLNTILNNLVGGHQMSLDQLMGYSSPSPQINAERALMSLCGMVLPQHTLPITNTSAPMSQPNNVAVQTLLMLIRQVGEEELQRRAQVDAIQNAIMTSIGRSLGQDGFSNNNSMQTQQGVIPPSRQQTLGSNHDNFVQRQQVGTSPPSAGNGNLNIQADSIAAILQAARRGEAAGWLEEDDDARNGSDDSDSANEDNNGDNKERPFSARKRNSSSDDDADDDDSWNERLRPRKKSPSK